MTDYSEWHDERINCGVFSSNSDIGKVAKITFDISGDGCFWAVGHDGQYFSGEVPDYCNDWAAIGLIIESSAITLDSPSVYGGAWRALGRWDFTGDSGYSDTAADKSPMRAAAICFLMMQEAKG